MCNKVGKIVKRMERFVLKTVKNTISITIHIRKNSNKKECHCYFHRLNIEYFRNEETMK